MKDKMDTLVIDTNIKNVLPGNFVGERLEDVFDYYDLASIQEWRSLLSLSYALPFYVDNKMFKTTQHALYYFKFRIVSEDISDLFSLCSKSKISEMDMKDLRDVTYKLIVSKETEVIWRSQFNSVFGMIMLFKISQHLIIGKALLATKNAELYENGSRMIVLENLRERLKNMNLSGF